MAKKIQTIVVEEEPEPVTDSFKDPEPKEESELVTDSFKDPEPKEEPEPVTDSFKDPEPEEEPEPVTDPFKDPEPEEEPELVVSSFIVKDKRGLKEEKRVQTHYKGAELRMFQHYSALKYSIDNNVSPERVIVVKD